MSDELKPKRSRGSGRHLPLPFKVQVGFAPALFERIRREADVAQCPVAAIVRQCVARTFAEDATTDMDYEDRRAVA